MTTWKQIMTSLASLFETEPRASRPDYEPGSAPGAQRLADVVGPPRQEKTQARVHADTRHLVALVDAAERDAALTIQPAAAAGGAPRRGRRRIRHIDWISVAAAALALVVLVGTAGIAGVQAATASPVADAVQALEDDRTALASAEQGLTSAVERLSAQVTTGLTQAETARAGIVGLDESIAAPDAQAPAVAAIDAYVAALQATVVPEVPEPYVPAVVDEESLKEVAAMIDDVRERSTLVDDTVTEVRAQRTVVEQSGMAYLQALSAFAASFPERAAREVEDNSWADQEYRDAVTSAAAVLAAAPLNDASGLPALIAYQDAVFTLRDEEERALLLVAQGEERARRDNARNDRQSSDGGTMPTDPTTPTEPEPDRGTTDPAQP